MGKLSGGRTVALGLLLPLCFGTALHGSDFFALTGLQPAEVHHLRSKDTGPIVTLRAPVGTEVKEGEVLLELEHARQLHAYKVTALRAKDKSSIRIAQGEVKKDQASLDELRQRARRRLATPEQVTRAEGNLETSQGKLERARLQNEIQNLDAELASKNLENRFIRSPIDGVVLAVKKAEGERVNSGQHVITVADVSQVAAEVPLLAKGAEMLRVGASLPVRLADGKVTRFATIQAIEDHPEGENDEKLLRLVMPNLSPDEDIASQDYELVLPESVEPAENKNSSG